MKIAAHHTRSRERSPSSAAAPVYRDPAAPVDARVRDLLSRMTPEEKVAQMIALWATKAEVMDGLEFDPRQASRSYPNGIGQISRASDKRGGPGVSAAAGGTAASWRTPGETVAFVNAVQDWALEETRLGIPVLFHEECLHGYMATEATVFPQAIALAGSWDPQLVRDVNAVIAREVRARGVHLVLSPVVDIVRDPRWGRIEETFGEDPLLAAEMGVAAVEGLQGDDRSGRLPPDRVYATLKHLTGHGQPEAGNNIAPAQVSERELRQNFLPPFRAVVERTGIRSVMPSYNEIDGVPSHASRWLLDDVLRGEWGFDGVIVSDYNGIPELASIHHVAENAGEAARLALRAGVDCDLPDGEAYRSLMQELREGRADVEAVDRAVARILELKFRAGLFENPYGDLQRTQEITGNDEARTLALAAARKTLCLLSNDGTLPLDADRLTAVAVVGPNAAVARLGGYSGIPSHSVSLLEGVRSYLEPKVRVAHAQGVFITRSEDRAADDVRLGDPWENRRLIEEAVEVCRDADVILLAIGDTEQTSREGFAAYHLGDRAELGLLAQQEELFDALQALEKPVVVCAINGRPPSWPGVVEQANAVLECWYPGQEGGTAIAEALFGQVNPGAKLPLTVVRDVGHVPYFYNHKPSARRGYLFDNGAPLFPFGHGLSYTTFEVSAPRLSASRVPAGQAVEVRVDVENTGPRSGDEVVQLYLRDEAASVTQPVKSLCAFQRVALEPGERRTLQFRLDASAFRIWNDRMEEVIEPGRFTIMTGPNSVDLKSATLEVTR